MKEAYVTFETAQRLKEKGFDWGCNGHWYIGEGKTFEISSSTDPINWNEVKSDLDWLSCPTQQMAMRWLREEKEIDIIPFHERLPHGCYWCRIERNLLTAHQQSPIYSSYEDAVEAALQYCLTKLI